MSFKANIEKLTERNNFYRKVLYTTKQMQLVLMSLNSNEEIGREKHPNISQFIRVEEGSGVAIVGRKRYRLKDGDAVIIPPNKYHNIIAGTEGLKLYTIYSPPEHRPDTKCKYKELCEEH